ncbi:metal-dependent phosphohydrolase, HD subdomain [Candidatus Vecturithrix granuli]|uniref:Metal-dependent phosphohydrolase, HD subdomain n=1 Tax=Vecturithrix granuli TaxID=1499967 RepID=A0A081C554_VECG1|nr:metal-dependent phosphohydrolase, HD subdomain [Candidatus Vecturithrix granuli]
MYKKQLEALRQRFETYVGMFTSNNPEIQRNMDLKQEHTLRVCWEIRQLGEQLNLDTSDLYLAEVMALFHDIGRFEQYTRYQTFGDSHSVNHAELGVQVLQRQGMLDLLDNATQNLILRVIFYHNLATVPQDETPQCLFFTRLLRDADKLDIWKVVIDYYYDGNGHRNDAISLGFPDTPGISDEVYTDLMARRIVDMQHLHNLNDFKLLQVGWIYDINFAPTFQAIQKRRYLKQIRATLPLLAQIERIFETIDDYLEVRLSTNVN